MRSWIGDRRERIQQGEKSVKGGGGDKPTQTNEFNHSKGQRKAM